MPHTLPLHRAGTWSKVSSTITGRRPFSKDAEFFDYEVDSDEEWDEEEAGERYAC